jgi:non-reducing end alpha-L-arabinofuranosidase
MYDGPRPNGYNPMKKQGATIWGIGGGLLRRRDDFGQRVERVDDAVQANFVAAGY